MSRPRRRLVPALALGLVPLLPAPGGGVTVAAPARPDHAASAAPGAAAPATPAHDLHIAYADMAIEGSVVAGRIRIFKDDLERALGPLVGADAVSLRPGTEADALVLRYLRDHLTVEVLNGTGEGDPTGAGARVGAGDRDPARSAVLEPTLVRSGEDMLDREPVWWVVVQYRAAGPIDTLRVRNILLFDVFDDQRNIMKFVRFPDETQKTFYFDEDEAEHVVTY